MFQSSFPRSFLYRVFSARSDLFFQAAGPLSSKQPTRANHAFFSDKIKKKKKKKLLSFPCKFFLLYIGQEPVTWAANNCLHIKVCSCVMSSNCIWLYCSCVNETTLFFLLRSLLPENGRSLRFPEIFIKNKLDWWSNDKIDFNNCYWTRSSVRSFVICKCLAINYLPQPSPVANNYSARRWKSLCFAQPRPIIVRDLNSDDGLHPSSKNPFFQNGLKCKT